ncbi:MAG: tetratricopeptide repeat protein [Deltaproteobacteria bacterium]|nr:tetratricopeptide repeat protein [Deltaproteobacteria bacterium]MBI3389443.1 tetratricopeptide repeat protein [Deltaproteobacteria bacterium]
MLTENEHRKLAAIMFTDMVGYSALAQRNEALSLALLHEQQQLVRPIFAQYSGREVKSTGDGFLVEFGSALQAVHCAIEIQKGMVQRNSSEAPDRRIQIRIGLHLGDVETRDGDVFGDGVNIAARIEPLAEPGGICISGAVYEQIRNKIDLPLIRLKQPQLKNIDVPVEVYRVVLPWAGGDLPHVGRWVRRLRQRGMRTWVIGVIIALVIAGHGLVIALVGAGVGRWFWPLFAAPATTPKPSAAASAEVSKSVAVLPFVNMSGNDADEYLSDGMSEEIITALSKVSGLRVAARTSSFFFKGKNEDIEEIGAKLRVGSVLEGSVRKVGPKLRVTAQLISTGDGYHLWSETYDEDTADILAIESAVAQRVAAALKVTLHASEQARLQSKPTENPEAHQLYLKGRYYVNRYSEEGLKKGLTYLQQAIALDPGYALAYQGLAYYYSIVNDWFAAPKDAMPKMRAAAEKALQIDPTLSEPHTFLAAFAWWYDWNWSTAEEEHKRALALDPNSVVAHEFYGQYLNLIRLAPEGIDEVRRAVAIDPLSPEANSFLGATLYCARRYADAIAQFRETLEMEPSYSFARLQLGKAYVQNGELERGIAELRRAKELDPHNPDVMSALGYAYAVARDRDAAQRAIDELRQQSQASYVSPYFFAVIYAALGETDQAFAFLDRAYEDRSFFISGLKVDPMVDALRADPRFTALLKKVGLDK